jgi:small subunit ribosomal protein S20
LAHSQRGWTGARTPSAIKRVRQTERRRLINQPRRTAAKTLISKAMLAATDAAANGGATDEVREAVERAVSALDRAAKLGAIHRNAADRRKSRLMLKVNATLGGDGLSATAKGAKVARTTSKAAAAKQAKARIAASRATKAKGAQTAAGKARAALARTTRDTSSEKAAAATAEPKTISRPAASKASGKASSRTSSTKTSSKTPAKSASTAKGAGAKTTTKKS